MKVPAKFVMMGLALVAFLSVSGLAAPAKQDGEIKEEQKPVRHHMNVGRMSQAGIELSKDTYTLLTRLRKIQGQDGRSPVCKICSMDTVDAITYDYFCMPDSVGVDGEICDMLTVLGTTPSRRITINCKVILSRHTSLCGRK